jgi:MFS family permease
MGVSKPYERTPVVFILAAVAVIFAVGGIALAYPTGVLRGSITAHSDQKQRRRHAMVGLLSAIAVVVGGGFAGAAIGFYLHGQTNLAISLLAAIPGGILLIILLLFISSKIAESSEDKARNQALSWRGAGALARAKAYNSAATQPVSYPGAFAGSPVSGGPYMPGSPVATPPLGSGQLPVDMRPGWVYHAGGEHYLLALGPSASYPQGAVVELPGFTVAAIPATPCVPVGPIEIQVLADEE